MMIRKLLAVGAIASSALVPGQPHLSLMGGKRVVTCVTLGTNDTRTDPGKAVVEVGDPVNAHVLAATHTYNSGGWVGLIARATLPDDGVALRYRCGCREDRDKPYDFGPWHEARGVPAAGAAVTLAVVADLGADCDAPGCGNATVDALNAAAGSLDGLLHAGDIAYIKGTAREAIYDAFFEQIAPVASRVPYHAAVGNQEHWNDFAGYENRFALNDTSKQLWHSADFGVVHAVFFSSEHNHSVGSPQYEWLAADLAAVDRSRTPWVVVLLHRPLYCSSNDYYDCVRAAPELRANLEPLFRRTKVDLCVAGHVHQYERTTPVYDATVVAPGEAPVYLVVGNAGDIEGLTKKFEAKPPWAVSRAIVLGWARITATAAELAVEHVASVDGTVLDAFSLRK